MRTSSVNPPLKTDTVNNIQKNIESSVTSLSGKDELVRFIAHSTPEQADARLEAYKGNGPMLATVNLNDIMASGSDPELLGKINRATEQFRGEAKNFNRQQVDLINQSEAVEKSSKEILTELVNLQDNQSELFKLSTRWEGKSLSDPESYASLVKLTSTYVNTYA